MPEFLTLLPPDEALKRLLSSLVLSAPAAETINARDALGRMTAQPVYAPHALPEFPRSTVDGYAVRARDTHGASDSLPAYLHLVGEVLMGVAPEFKLSQDQCALIHTGGMLPENADAVVMLEYTQPAGESEIEIQRALAMAENVIQVGEDTLSGQQILPVGRLIRPADIGGLMAFGIQELRVVKMITVGLIATGDEVVSVEQHPDYGQVRDINTHTLAALVKKSGGEAVAYGIAPDDFGALETLARKALLENDILIITAGSSASVRDLTAAVIQKLGKPGVLVHGINTRPGKPTILGVCEGKPVIGLPGNPISALVNGYLLVAPIIEHLLRLPANRPRPSVRARLTVNLPSQAGREDWQPVILRANQSPSSEKSKLYDAEPVFGKSNLIFSLAAADGLLKIPADATGLSAGATVEVYLL